MTATSITECQRFATLVAAAGGTVPDPIRNLLSAWEVLTAPAATEAPGNSIMDAALAGTLDEKTLQKMLPGAAAAHSANEYRSLLARDSEHTLIGQIHREFRAGCADSVLDSLREKFTIHVAAIAVARSLFSPDSDPAHVLSSGEAGTIEAWQGLPEHLQAVAAIGAVAAQFGPSPVAWFPQIREFPAAENFKVSDIAVFCGDGDSLVIDSAPFLVPSGDHKASPWFRVAPLKLHSVASATARYRRWCAAEHDRVYGDRPRGGRVGEDGQVHLDAIPPNPYREEVDA